MSLSRAEIHAMAAPWLPDSRKEAPLSIHTDTSDFFRIESGDVVLLAGAPYLIRNSVREGRFGLDDEVKYWVKRAVELSTGGTKIIKLVFHEQFTANIGGIVFDCFRSPRKEGRILALVKDHPHFMHGSAAMDSKGNLVRVLDYISGRSLADCVAEIGQPHETYFFETLPGILAQYIRCIEAIRFLHDHGEKHGDIRRDHILVEHESGRYRWIDFDYNYRHRENIYGYDLFGLGNVLVYLIGKGDVLLADLRRESPAVAAALVEGDMNIVFHNRLANLKKVFGYIPDSLNRVLLHFSKGAHWFYEHTEQLLHDLSGAAANIR
jgi:hypothetical protein